MPKINPNAFHTPPAVFTIVPKLVITDITPLIGPIILEKTPRTLEKPPMANPITLKAPTAPKIAAANDLTMSLANAALTIAANGFKTATTPLRATLTPSKIAFHGKLAIKFPTVVIASIATTPKSVTACLIPLNSPDICPLPNAELKASPTFCAILIRLTNATLTKLPTRLQMVCKTDPTPLKTELSPLIESPFPKLLSCVLMFKINAENGEKKLPIDDITESKLIAPILSMIPLIAPTATLDIACQAG